jgi:hypothetical protein
MDACRDLANGVGGIAVKLHRVMGHHAAFGHAGASGSTVTKHKHSRTYIAYYRVSTDKQGRSGLELEAQRAAIASYVASGQVTAGGLVTPELLHCATGS